MPVQFPCMVSMRTLQNQHFCGGFILSDRFIASAAHCIHQRFLQPNVSVAVVGSHSLAMVKHCASSVSFPIHGTIG